MRRIPILATLIVWAAATVMVSLGLWQLDRRAQKEALLAQYAAALNRPERVALPGDAEQRAQLYYRRTSFDCPAQGQTDLRAGHNAQGKTGWAHWGECLFEDGSRAEINLGWSAAPKPVAFTGAMISGVIAPDGQKGARVVADQPLPGLEASATPDPNDVPNNHLAYAVQWFFFALTALVIFALALRGRLRKRA